jgi:hypothetical protein
MNYIESDKLLFVLASPGGGGHRLGRLVSCLNNVHWYSHAFNGLQPYDVSYNNIVNGKDISPYHFDRLYNNRIIPVVGERLERYFDSADHDKVYKLWNDYMNTTDIDQILSNKYLLYVLHDNPADILNRFPNCKIINLIDVDIESTADRYIKTTALFPIHINSINPRPWYINAFNKKITELCSMVDKPTYRDYWAYITYNTLYVDDYVMEYKDYVIKIITEHNNSLITDYRVMNTTWESIDVDELIQFINAVSIDSNYTKLLAAI